VSMFAAIETTGDTCGVALLEGDALRVELHVDIPRSHDRLLAWMFREMLNIASITPRDIEALAVSVGPGSYTGIRIGISFAEGLALASGVRIVPVPTLDAIAFAASDLGKIAHRSRVISLVSAGKMGVYAGLYEVRPDFRRLTESRTVPIDQIPPLLDENVFVAGPGARLIDRSCMDSIAIDSEVLTARSVGERGLVLYRQGVGAEPAEVEPLYISGITSAPQVAG
jgi:tRNA threonylcarbamoyladenosine biosynthesis protein TsaB